MFVQPTRPRVERRKKKRIQLTRGMIARFGTTAALILDITDSGARIEHFVRLEVGRRARFRLIWREKTVEVEATVVCCRVQRFAGDEQGTVYESGLCFREYIGHAAEILRDLVGAHVAQFLAEHLANARGIEPASLRTASVDRGYIRCTLIGSRWEKKWIGKPEQPEDGFTVLASEPVENIDCLCEQYQNSTAHDRELIRQLARVSVEPVEV